MEEVQEHLEIRHVYGKVESGLLIKNKLEGITGCDRNFESVSLSADQLAVIDDDRKALPTSAIGVSAAFRSAENVLFLGFGFEKTNCRLLGMERDFSKHMPTVYATRYEMTDAETIAIQARTNLKIEWLHHSFDCMDAMRNHLVGLLED